MPFNEERSYVSTTFGTYNDIQGDQYNVAIYQYQSHDDGMTQQPSLLLDTTLRYMHKHVLPSPPEIMIGRDKEKGDIVGTLLQKSPARVAILGGGGMGKTTLALSILHDDAIAKHYPSRYFVSCEGVLSTSSLIEAIANALRVPLAKRDAYLIDTIFSTFPNATLLCLDNFETLWDDEAMRPEIEEFLSLLQHRVLSLIITMRGSQRPLRVSWTKPFLSPLQPLTKDVSRRVFEEMAKDTVDEFAEKLLAAVDGIPLAISLISALLQEGHESLQSLWSRWETQSGVLKHGSKHRLSNLDASIYLSVHGPRMREDPTTIDILVMLSALPDGFPDDEQAVEELQHLLPDGYDFRNALLTLRHVSLVQVVQADGAAVRRRLRILSPIQSYCQRTLEGSEELTKSITAFYIQKMSRFARIADPDERAIIPSELHNVRALLMHAWRRGKGDETIALASIRFTSWSGYLGNHVEEVIRAAIEGGAGNRNNRDLQGTCHRELGHVQTQQNKLDAAEVSLKHAAELHRQAHSVLGEGKDLYLLGNVYLRRDKLDKAEVSLKRAAELHQGAHNILGEGRDLYRLGEVQLRQDKLDEAEVSLKRAAELHQQAHDIAGEGRDLYLLGKVYLRQDQLEQAETSFKRAAELHRQARDIVGEGRDLNQLGEVQLRQEKLNEAEASFKRAAELHKEACDVVGEGNDLGNLAEVHLRQSRLDEAGVLLKRAAELHRQAHDVHGEGGDLYLLGGVHLKQSQLDNAGVSLKRAAELHRQACDIVGEGSDLFLLGHVQLRRSELDEADASLKRAAELHRQVHDIVGEGTDLCLLGHVQLRRSKLDEAGTSFKRAAELHQQAHDIVGEGNDLCLLGEVQLRQNRLDEAETSFKRAAELHQQANNIVSEGDNLRNVAEVHFRQSRLDEAEVSSKRAAELHQQAHNVLSEGHDLCLLGKVQLRQNKLDEAESSFKRAAELHKQAHDTLSEQLDLQMLEQVYSRRSKLDRAQAPFKPRPQALIRDGSNAVLELGPAVRSKASAPSKGATQFHPKSRHMNRKVSSRLGPTPAQNQESSPPNPANIRNTIAQLFSTPLAP